MDVNEPHMVGVGMLWPVSPITDEILGQIELAPSGSLDSTFYAMIGDFAGAPRELVDVTTGGIVGYSKQSFYVKGYNSALSDTTGLTAPAVAEHRIFYSPETGEISRWLS